MSRIPITPGGWMNPAPDKLKRKAHQLHDVQPCEVRSQRLRRMPPSTLPSAPDTSNNVTPQYAAHTGLSRPSPVFEAGDRLPGVRQLLLPHSFAGLAHSTSSTRQLPEQSRRFSSITISPLSGSLPSPSIRASETSIRTPLSEPHKSVLSAGQHSDSTSADAMAAINNNKKQHLVQATPQQFRRLPSFTDSVSSPQSSKYKVFRANPSPCGSPGSHDINQNGNYGPYARQQGDLHEGHRLTQRPTHSSPWQNAHNHLDWGTTKAGKPRKRLAQACLSCRQKKIRCHPNSMTTKCLQCEKAGSDCKFESGSRLVNQAAVSHGDRRAHLTNFESTIGGTQSVSNIATGCHPTRFQRHGESTSIAIEKSPSITSAASLDDVSDYVGWQVKQQKRETDPKNDKSNATLGTAEARRSSKGLSPVLNAPPVCHVIDTLGFAAADWTNDPYDISPLTMEYLDLYFAHINQATYCMLPKGLFLKWVRECHDKTPDDKMILYSLMAMGCRFSEKKESIADSKRLLQIARHAEQSSFGRFTLQLAQARLILALLSFSLGNSSEAWDYCGTALRAVCGLKYNVEEGINEQPDLEDCEYGLNRETLAECRRRTFWSACIMDRFNGFCSGHLSMLHQDDCFLRLPCREDLYEIQEIPDTPCFPTLGQSLTGQEQASLGNMAFLIAISSAWSDVLQYLYRTKHRVIGSDHRAYESFYVETQQQLQAFKDRLPPHLYPCDTSNMEQALDEGYIGTLISLHALYHAALMKLNRHALYTELKEEGLKRNLKAAQYHARKLLKITHTLSALHRNRASAGLAWTFSTPFQGYSILSAVDILTSVGSLADLSSDLQLVQSSLEVVQELSKYWASAEKQLKMIAVRFKDIMKALEGADTEDTVFVTTDPMEDTFGKVLDLLFSPPVEARLKALALNITTRDGSHVLSIESGSPGIGGYGS